MSTLWPMPWCTQKFVETAQLVMLSLGHLETKQSGHSGVGPFFFSADPDGLVTSYLHQNDQSGYTTTSQHLSSYKVNCKFSSQMKLFICTKRNWGKQIIENKSLAQLIRSALRIYLYWLCSGQIIYEQTLCFTTYSVYWVIARLCCFYKGKSFIIVNT